VKISRKKLKEGRSTETKKEPISLLLKTVWKVLNTLALKVEQNEGRFIEGRRAQKMLGPVGQMELTQSHRRAKEKDRNSGRGGKKK